MMNKQLNEFRIFKLIKPIILFFGGGEYGLGNSQ